MSNTEGKRGETVRETMIVCERQGLPTCFVKRLGHAGNIVMTWDEWEARRFSYDNAVRRARELTAESKWARFDVREVGTC